MDSGTEAQVIEVISDILNVPAPKLTRESSPQSLPKWDSVAHVNLTLALEQRFAVTLEPEDISEMRSVGDILRVMAAKLP